MLITLFRYGGKLLAEGEYVTFQYLVVYIAVMQGGMAAGQWLSYAPNIAQATAAANRILASRPPRQGTVEKQVSRKGKDEDKSFEAGVDSDSQRGVRVEFLNVWFRYPTRDAPVLNGLNLTVRTSSHLSTIARC